MGQLYPSRPSGGRLVPVRGLIGIVAPVSGIVDTLAVHEGERVDASQVLAHVAVQRSVSGDGDTAAAQQARIIRRQQSLSQAQVAQEQRYDVQARGLDAQLSATRRELSQVAKQTATRREQVRIASDTLAPSSNLRRAIS